MTEGRKLTRREFEAQKQELIAAVEAELDPDPIDPDGPLLDFFEQGGRVRTTFGERVLWFEAGELRSKDRA